MKIGLAWCGGSAGKGIQGACAPMSERVRCESSEGVEQSEFSEHSEYSEGLADARLWLGVGAA